MATITAETVKTLREQSGAGVMECKRALEETGGDIEKAAAILKERGQAAAAKRAGREANEGQIASYIHTGGKIGVLIEVNCETDFVARTDEFQRLVRDLAIQVAGLRPSTPRRVDPGGRARGQEGRAHGRRHGQGKPEAVRAQIVEGQLKKWFAEVVLSSSRSATRIGPSAS
jgi:elongation factor Ts